MTYEEKYFQMRRKFILKTIDLYNSTSSYPDIEIKKEYKEFDEFLGTPEICTECGGLCCKHFPCLFSPYDFIDVNNIEYMKKILDLGIITIGKSCYDDSLVLRPRGIKDKKTIVNTRLPLHNRCILFGPTGCLLNSNYRPSEALLFYAKSLNNHLEIYSTGDCIDDWINYQDSLNKLAEIYKKTKTEVLIPPEPELVKKLTRRIAGYKR